jgi:pimeloyl-ACP methyl ester carboxylesterase
VPELARPDGARIHYEVRGEGPLVVLTPGSTARPEEYEGLTEDLLRDHAVLIWHPRGYGPSPAVPPFSLQQDADDLAELVAELGVPAKAFGAGIGVSTSAYAAARGRGAIVGLVAHGIATALLGELDTEVGIGTSRSVIELLAEQMRHDPRATARALVTSTNEQLDEQGIVDRVDALVEYQDVDTTRKRAESLLAGASALAELRRLGDALVLPRLESDPWQEGSWERIGELLPEARVSDVADGPMSRPDLFATLIRELP